MKRAVFLDRDGIINKVILRAGQPFAPSIFDEFELVDGVNHILQRFKAEGFLNIIITNQPDIARGLMVWETLNKMHGFIEKQLPIDDIFVCPHDDAGKCQCRKPQPGMILEAAEKWSVTLRSSFVVGDRWKDIEAGRRAGCITILLDYPYNKGVTADFRVNDLRSAAEVILNNKESLCPFKTP